MLSSVRGYHFSDERRGESSDFEAQLFALNAWDDDGQFITQRNYLFSLSDQLTHLQYKYVRFANRTL